VIRSRLVQAIAALPEELRGEIGRTRIDIGFHPSITAAVVVTLRDQHPDVCALAPAIRDGISKGLPPEVGVVVEYWNREMGGWGTTK
jgi:hypothetical protein